MARVNVHSYGQDEQCRYAGWYDDSTLTEDVSEKADWNGNNHVGRCSGLQTSRQRLLRTKAGRWVRYNDARSEFNGPLKIEFVTDDEAREWLLRNDEVDLAEKYFGPVGQERPDLEVMGRQLRRALENYRTEAVRQMNARIVSESAVARWGGFDRGTVHRWRGKY